MFGRRSQCCAVSVYARKLLSRLQHITEAVSSMPKRGDQHNADLFTMMGLWVLLPKMHMLHIDTNTRRRDLTEKTSCRDKLDVDRG